MTSIPKNVYIDQLYDIVNEYNNTYHVAIKIKPVDLKWRTYIVCSKANNETNPKFKTIAMVRISIDKNILTKGCTSN